MNEICFGELSTARQPFETRSRGRAFGVDSLPLVFKLEQLLASRIDLSDYVFARMS
jgi:hypothetical protein